MGRLRDDYESPLIRGMTAEIVELFGVDDSYLLRYSAANNLTIKDPLYSEPMTDAAFKRFRVPCLFQDWAQETAGDVEGRDDTKEVSIFLAIDHLTGAHIPADPAGEYVAAGDVMEIHARGAAIFWDILQIKREGWINDSDKFSGYTLTCKRNDKYVPERKAP